MPDQSLNLAALRGRHSGRVYVSLMTGTPILTGTVSAAPTLPALALSYTLTSGNAAHVKAGMRVVVTGADGAHKGTLSVRYAGSITSSSLPVREFADLHLSAGDTLTVYDDVVLTDKLVSGDAAFAPDSAAYTDQNSDPPPVAHSGGAWAGWIGVDIPFTGSGSYAVDPDSAGGLTHLWDAPGGTFVSGTTTSADPVIRYGAAGRYRVTHTVTDASNGKSETQFARVRVHDANDPPYECLVSSLDGDGRGGFRASFEAFENTGVAAIPDGAPVMVWTDGESFGSAAAGRSHVLCAGFVRRDRSNGDADGAQVEFEVISPLARLAELPGFSKALTRAESPDGWNAVRGLSVKRAIIQLLRQYSNALHLFDLTFSGFADADYPAFYLQKATPYDQVMELAESRDARLTCDRAGRLNVARRLEWTPLADRAALTTTITLGADDVIAYEARREHQGEIETFRARGMIASTGLPAFARFPASPGRGSASPISERLIVDDAADLRARCALRAAWQDRLFIGANGTQQRAPDVRLTLFGGYAGLFQFEREWVALAGVTTPRGIDLAGLRLIVERVRVDYADGTATTTLDLRGETHAPAWMAVDDPPPETSILVSEPPITLPPPVVPRERELIGYTGTNVTPTKLLVIASSSAQAAVATGVTAGGTLVYSEISSGLSGTPIWGSSDPFAYDTFFLVTTTGLYRCKPFAFTGWTLVADNVTMWGNGAHAQKLILSINRRGWLYQLSDFSGCAWSSDYGVTWARSGSMGTGMSPYYGDVVVSPFNDGASAVGWMYRAQGSAGNTALYKSTDWGQTWTLLNGNYYSSGRVARLHLPYKRGAAAGYADNINDSAQWIYWQSGGGHSLNDGGLYLSKSAGALPTEWIFHQTAGGVRVPASSAGGTALQTFTYDGDRVLSATLLTGADGNAGGLRIFDGTTQVYTSGASVALNGGQEATYVNGFAYHRDAALWWSRNVSALRYTFDAGATVHSANVPGFFTGGKQIAYAEWSLIDQWR